MDDSHDARLDERREREAHAHDGDPTIIGSAPSFVATLDAIGRVAQSSAPVLLVGETGTGKDVLAQRIHARSARRNAPFVVVNAGAIPAALLDSELFGHVGGAFTGATHARRGLVNEADGGTLFLDEIVDLPIELQGRLLRVLESGFVRAVGADHERHVDVRFLAATHRDLALAVKEGRFREDLYFRLNVLAIRVPPLRARRDDIPMLTRYFFDRARARNPSSPARTLLPAAEDALAAAPWRGNVRELASVMERLVVLTDHEAITSQDLDGLLSLPTPVNDGWPPQEMCSLKTITARYVEWVLDQCDGDKTRAARVLGVDVSTLYRWQRRDASS